MRSLRFACAEALVSQPGAALRGLDGVAHDLYPLLFKASYLLERAELVRRLLRRWPLREFRLAALLGPGADHAGDLRARACGPCLEACVRGLAEHALRGAPRLRLADLTGVRDGRAPQCPCGRALGRWGRTELLARTCCELQAGARAGRRAVEVRADLFVTQRNVRAVARALAPAGPAPLRLRCASLRADSLGAAELLRLLRLAGPAELRQLQVVHNVRLHAGHVRQLLAPRRLPQLVSLTLPARALDAPAAGSPAADGEDPLLASIAWELGQMTRLAELSVAFSTLTGKLQKLLGPLRSPLRALDLANCSLNHADMAFLADSTHAAHLEVLDLSGHSLFSLFPSTFSRLLGRAAQTLRVLTLEECSIADGQVSVLALALGACRQLQELRFLGNPLSAPALRRLFTALCELPRLCWVEFPVPTDCYPEGTAYPQDELAASKFDRQKYDAIAEDLRGVLLRAGREDVQVSTPVFGSFDPDIQETRDELGASLLQAFKTVLENFSQALRQME